VTFNGTTATITSWSATSIVATVPTGATTGNVVVAGQRSTDPRGRFHGNSNACCFQSVASSRCRGHAGHDPRLEFWFHPRNQHGEL
jgi:hypothetical protein